MIGIDSNILIYAHDKASPYYNEAKQLIHTAVIEDLLGVSEISLREFYAVITDGRKISKPFTPESASTLLKAYFQSKRVVVCPLTSEAWKKAFEYSVRYKISGYVLDDLLIALSLWLNGIGIVYTRNIQDFKNFDFIDAVNPFDKIPTVKSGARNRSISYGRQSVDERDVAAVCSVLRSDFLTTGSVAAEFEHDLCELTGAKHAIACSNGTTALHLASLALHLNQDSLGVTSPITFLSSANCVEFCGGRADFVDIDPETLCLSPGRLEEYCEKTAVPDVVIPVDFAGVPADLPAIWDLANRYGFKVIEDAAHAIGTTYNHNGSQFHCGGCKHSELAIFSFHPVKTITTGEGGAVLTNDDQMADRIRGMRSHGVERNAKLMERNDGPWYYEMSELSFNCRITDFQCALGKSQLRKLDHFKQRRKEIVDMYNAAFRENPALIVPKTFEDASICYHLYPLQFKKGNETRHRVFNDLAKDRIFCQIHYIPVYWQPYYKNKYGYEMGKCPQAETYYRRCLSLPLYPALNNDEVNYVINTTLSCL